MITSGNADSLLKEMENEISKSNVQTKTPGRDLFLKELAYLKSISDNIKEIMDVSKEESSNKTMILNNQKGK